MYRYFGLLDTEADSFEHMTAADGTPQRFRRSGQTKYWKTRPNEFRIPVKRGLYESGYITHENAANFVAV